MSEHAKWDVGRRGSAEARAGYEEARRDISEANRERREAPAEPIAPVSVSGCPVGVHNECRQRQAEGGRHAQTR